MRRKAREAQEALQCLAREHRLNTVVRCEFTNFESGGQGIGRIASFEWIMIRPEDKLHLFDHDRLNPPAISIRLDNLKAAKAVREPCLTGFCPPNHCLCWKMQLRWEQFHNVAADAQNRATEKFGIPYESL